MWAPPAPDERGFAPSNQRVARQPLRDKVIRRPDDAATTSNPKKRFKTILLGQPFGPVTSAASLAHSLQLPACNGAQAEEGRV